MRTLFPGGVTPSQSLREQTRGHHDAAECLPAFQAPFGETYTLDAYARLLNGLRAAFAVLEEAAIDGAPVDLRGWLRDHRQVPDLEHDLALICAQASIRLPAPPDVRPPAALGSARHREAAALGTLYVLYGSTLGSTVVGRALVEHFDPELCARLRFHALKRQESLWAHFRSELDRRLHPDQLDDAVVAARAAFEIVAFAATGGEARLDRSASAIAAC